MPRPRQRRRNDRATDDDLAILDWTGVDLDLNAQLNASNETAVGRRRGADDRRRADHGIPAPRPRLRGWSLIFVTAANLTLVLSVTVVGLSLVGIAACAALALVSWILVLAEALSLRRLYGPPDRSPEPDLGLDLDVDID